MGQNIPGTFHHLWSRYVSQPAENKRLLKTIIKSGRVVEDYSAFLEQHPYSVGTQICDVSLLPHLKQTILQALCYCIVTADSTATVNRLQSLAMGLLDFQRDVGETPMSTISLGLERNGTQPEGKKTGYKNQKPAHNARVHFAEQFRTLITLEASYIRAQLQEAYMARTAQEMA